MTETAKPEEPAALTVYYDGACPLCRREIGLYQSRKGADRLDWVDIANAKSDVAPGLSADVARSRFHVRRASGELVSGAAGFAELWSALPGWRFPGRIAALPGIAFILERAYRSFLHVRPVLQRGFFWYDARTSRQTK